MVNNLDSTHSHNNTKPGITRGFRTDIEGLRAIAILAVIAAHAHIPFFQGGFIGVDIFFVLSGYLITGLLVHEINATGKLDFVAFYARRFKRLLPGLVLMLLVSSLAAAIVLAPAEQYAQAATAQSAFLWLSNFYFVFANFDYFDTGAENNLFLHTWSLGVEEQFYVVWPLLVLLLMIGIAAAGRDREQSLLGGFVLIFTVSLFASIVLSSLSPLWGFYSMPSRGWQFALGAIVFIYVERACRSTTEQIDGSSKAPPKMYALTGWVGLMLVLASALFIDPNMIYPGGLALAPSFGTALLLFSGSANSLPFVSQLLSTRPMRMIGRVSYSWYLWHWPVLIIGNVLLQREQLVYQLLLVAISLLLATVAFYTVEMPARNNRALGMRSKLTAIGALTVMAAGVWLSNIWTSSAQTWATSPSQAIYAQVRSDLPTPYSMGCDEWFSNARVKVCSFGDNTATKTAVLFGDSVGMQWFSAFRKHFEGSEWRLLVVTKSACPMVDKPIFYSRIGSEYVVCELWRNAAVKFLAELKPQMIFMGSAADYKFTEEEWTSGTERILAPLAIAAEKIFIIRGTPRLPFDGPGCLARHDWQPGFLANLSACNAKENLVPDQQVLEALQTAANGFANVRVLDLNDVVCPDGICAAFDGHNLVFRDTQHITNRFVESVSQDVANAIAKTE